MFTESQHQINTDLSIKYYYLLVYPIFATLPESHEKEKLLSLSNSISRVKGVLTLFLFILLFLLFVKI